MSMTGNPEQWREPFPENEIPFILMAVLRCMADERKKSPEEHENPISIRLWKRLRNDLDLRQRPILPLPEVWEINENAPKGSVGCLDIGFIYSTGISHPWPIFAIEAKRLHVEFPSGWKSLVSDYVTSNTLKSVEQEQGMMCFVSGRYSQGLRAGAMLGYVFDGDVSNARKSIAITIKKHSTKLRTNGKLCESRIVPSQSGILESRHQSSGGNGGHSHSFTIYHLLVAI
ncbi:MAG: hypothetical protein NTV46_18650 [Verrucomicrobia bacterium]|nr:hypothetical protein [Verrucomicrobiota bacterium]